MSDFSFTATAQCDRCGNYLSSSTEDCDECSEDDLRRYHFECVVGNREMETTWSINPVRAWHDLMDKIEEPLGWRCVETNTMGVQMSQIDLDVRELWREKNGYDETTD